MKLTVCLLASEAAPLSKTGGLADVSAALTKYLHSVGHDVRLFTPLYKSIDRVKLGAQPLEGLQSFEVAVGPHQYLFSVLLAQLPGSTQTDSSVLQQLKGWLLFKPVVFGSRGSLDSLRLEAGS